MNMPDNVGHPNRKEGVKLFLSHRYHSFRENSLLTRKECCFRATHSRSRPKSPRGTLEVLFSVFEILMSARVGLGGLGVNVLASRSKVRGFKSGRDQWIFSGRKNLKHKSSGRDFKLRFEI